MVSSGSSTFRVKGMQHQSNFKDLKLVYSKKQNLLFAGCLSTLNACKCSITEAEQPDGDELTIDDYDDLYCPACDKSFKSDKA